MFKDFCPLCGYRFEGEAPEEICDQILEHIANETCQNNWVPPLEAFGDDGSGPGKGLYKPKEEYSNG